MENSIKRDSMVFYESFFEALVDLPPEEFKKCACAIFGYGLRGEEPESTGIEKTIFILVKPQIDKNNQRWLCAKKSHSSSKNSGTAESKTKCVYENNKFFKKESVKDETCDCVDERAVEAFEVLTEEESLNEEPQAFSEKSSSSPNETKEACGEYGNVYLSVVERGKLVASLGIDEYMKRLEFFSAYLKRKPQHKSACHYIDLSDWVGTAVAERRKNAPEKKNPSFDFEFEDIFESP